MTTKKLSCWDNPFSYSTPLTILVRVDANVTPLLRQKGINSIKLIFLFHCLLQVNPYLSSLTAVTADDENSSAKQFFKVERNEQLNSLLSLRCQVSSTYKVRVAQYTYKPSALIPRGRKTKQKGHLYFACMYIYFSRKRKCHARVRLCTWNIREHNGVANFCQKGKKRRHGSSNSAGMAPA